MIPLIPENENTPIDGYGWAYGLNKYLGCGFNNSKSEISINIGVGIGSPVTPKVPLDKDGKIKGL